MPAPLKLMLTDYELLERLAAGQTQAEIALAEGVSPSCVSDRLRRLREHLPAPAARRAEETIARTLDCVQEVHDSVATLHALKAACEKQLLGEDGALDTGPHDFDVSVIVSLGGRPPVRKRLRDLMGDNATGALSVETSAADPRTLLISVIAQIRSHLELAVRMQAQVYNLAEMQRFQAMVLDLIARVSPAEAQAIKAALIESRKVRLSLVGPGEPLP